MSHFENLLSQAKEIYHVLWQWELHFHDWINKKKDIPSYVESTFSGEDWKRQCEPFPLVLPSLKGKTKEELCLENGITIVVRYRDDLENSVYLEGRTIRAKANNPVDYLACAAILARYPWLEVDIPVYEGTKDPGLLPYPVKRYFFRRILLGRKPSAGLRFLDQTTWLDVYMPEVTAGKNLSQNRYHAYDIYEHLLRACDAVLEADEEVRWAALLHDTGKVNTRKLLPNGEASFHNHEMISARQTVDIMKRLGIPRELGQRVRFLVRNHMFHYTDEWTDRAVRRFMRRVSREDLKKLIALRLADRKGSGKKTAFPRALQKLILHIEQVEKEEKRFKVKDLAINGYDLMKLGMKPGPEMGALLRRFTEAVASGLLANDPEILLARAREEISRKAS
ncbi:MAG: HD domain-containing protein [Leptospiraceae bacterium]|nr:HD domain-containing protein [Leptospiraceae bacterium]MDW8307468.1 HD domain-containing protein [Leptospiraceae bacterium]